MVTAKLGAAPVFTVKTAVSHTVVLGAGAHTLYVTVQVLLATGVVKLAKPVAASTVPVGVHALAACVTPVVVKVEPVGYSSLVATLYVPGTNGCKVPVASLMASITGVVTVLVHVAPTGQALPPPVTVAVLTALGAAAAATVTGTVITIGPAAPAAMEQPTKLVAPVAGQPVRVPPVAVIAPLLVMPAGKVSAMVIGAVVGPLVTAIVMV